MIMQMDIGLFEEEQLIYFFDNKHTEKLWEYKTMNSTKPK